MDIESSLRHELSQIPRIANAVYPLIAPEGCQSPFLVYSMLDKGYIETLDGIKIEKDSKYEINILCDSYAELKSIYIDVEVKLNSMIERLIGNGHIFVQNVSLGIPKDAFEPELELHRIIFEASIFY